MDKQPFNILTEIQSRIKDFEKKTPVPQLKDYYILEEELLSKLIVTNNRHLKYKLYTMLYNSFFSTSKEERRDIEKIIKHLIFYFYFSFNTTENRKRLFTAIIDKDEIIEYRKKRKKVSNTIWSACEKHVIEQSNKVDVIPNFIVCYEKKLIKKKIDINLQRHFNYPMAQVVTYNNQAHSFLQKEFQAFFDGKTLLFDDKVFDENDRMIIFGAFALTNRSYINQKEQNKKIFFNNVKKYITILNLKGKYKELTETIKNMTTDNEYDFDSEKTQAIGKIIEMKEKNQGKYLLLVFSLSCLLNSFVNETESSSSLLNEKRKMQFTPQLKCSAKERQFLINILKEIDALGINYILETFVFQYLIKNYTKILYDDNNRTKILLKYPLVIDAISKVSTLENKDSTLNEIEAKVFSLLFQKFKKDKEMIFNETEEGFFSSLLFSSNQPTLTFNLNGLFFNNQHPFRTSTHICICIDGQFCNKVSYYRNVPFASLIYDSESTNADFYYFNWQNNKNFFKMNIESIAEVDKVMEREAIINKKVAKFYGKFLAYIIVSRGIFQFQSISLLGFSLGCHIIKHCLLELNKISGKMDTDDIINEVIFIGAATNIDKDKYPNIFTNVAGRIVNVYNDKDDTLRYFNNGSLGLKQLSMISDKDTIVNIDASKSSLMKQEEYKGEMTKLVSEFVKIY